MNQVALDGWGDAQGAREAYRRPTMAELVGTPRNGLTAVGSFSGCGGSSAGLTWAGWSVPYAVEFIPAAQETYRANFPTTYVDPRDIREIEADEILHRLSLRRGELDLLEGSPPCASFSAAGNRDKAWGEVKKYSDTEQRTDDLFWEWARLLEGLQPRAFVAENVPGLLIGRALEEYAYKIHEALAEKGYHVHSKVLNSSWYGVPQDRRRLIFAGIRNDVGDAPPDFPAPTAPEPPYSLEEALADVTSDNPEHLEESSMERFAVGRTWKAITEARAAGREFDFAREPCQRCGEPLYRHQDLETTSTGLVTKAKCADGGKAEILKDYYSLVVPPLDRPCPTVTATGSQPGAASVVHPTECRKFTPAELKSICGFPPDFVLTGTREQQCERMGRAVTPPLYREVGKRIAEALR